MPVKLAFAEDGGIHASKETPKAGFMHSVWRRVAETMNKGINWAREKAGKAAKYLKENDRYQFGKNYLLPLIPYGGVVGKMADHVEKSLWSISGMNNVSEEWDSVGKAIGWR